MQVPSPSLFKIPPTLLPTPPPLAPGPSVVWMGPTGAGTGTGRGAVSDRNPRGWPGRGLGPGFLKGGWAKAGTHSAGEDALLGLLGGHLLPPPGLPKPGTSHQPR